MKKYRNSSHILSIALLLLLSACGKKIESPLDSSGANPEATFTAICELIIDEKLEEAQSYYSPAYIEEFMKKHNKPFSEYVASIAEWKKEWLTAKPMGNDYNENVWRVKMIPDEGKGKENRPGVVYDFHIIDGHWKVVFWNHYPKSE